MGDSVQFPRGPVRATDCAAASGSGSRERIARLDSGPTAQSARSLDALIKIMGLWERSLSVRSPAVGWDMEVEVMKVTLGASTGAKIAVWREKDLFQARRVDRKGEPQTCGGRSVRGDRGARAT